MGKPLKVILFGQEGMAKTSFVNHFESGSPFIENVSSIGVKFHVHSINIDGERVKIQIWEFSENERFRFLQPTCIQDACGAIFVYDVTLPESFRKMDQWLRLVRDQRGTIPIAIFGMKNSDEDEVLVTESTVTSKMSELGIPDSFLISAPTREKIEDVLESFSRRMLWD